MHGPHGGLDLRAYRLDGGEVVGAHKPAGRRLHDLLVQVLGVKPGPVDEKGVADAGVIDAVGVLLFDAGTDGVEAVVDFRGLDHHNVLRQAGVHRQGEPVAGNGGGGTEVGDIGLRMDARVGTARAGALHRVAHHRCQRFLQGLLHGDGVLLDLPPVVGRPHIHQF